jgi:hypothetical protein
VSVVTVTTRASTFRPGSSAAVLEPAPGRTFFIKMSIMRSGSWQIATLAALGLVACGNSTPTFSERARAIAVEYEQWGRVDDEIRWAPFLCRLPGPAVAWVSKSDDASTHGQKLYSVFAKKRAAYPDGPHAEQVIVKQSWTAERAEGVVFDPPETEQKTTGDHFYPYALKDGVVYKAGARAGLYIMFKVDPATPDTDAGWVYATISPAGEITASGRVASCMGCHEHAKHERLFGVPGSSILSRPGSTAGANR